MFYLSHSMDSDDVTEWSMLSDNVWPLQEEENQNLLTVNFTVKSTEGDWNWSWVTVSPVVILWLQVI